jgi:hypothetical protein
LKIGLFDNQTSVSVQEGAKNAQSMTFVALFPEYDWQGQHQHVIYRFGMRENVEAIHQKSKYKQDDGGDNDCSQD